MGQKGQLTHFVIHDPATGSRLRVSRSDFQAFFGRDGTVYPMTCTGSQQPMPQKKR